MAGTYLENEDYVVSDDYGNAKLTNDGRGTGAGTYRAEAETPVDTDDDSWDSGSNVPDVKDRTRYKNDVEPVDSIGEDPKIDEGQLGNEGDGEPDPDDIPFSNDDFEPLDDEEIDDRTFDCD